MLQNAFMDQTLRDQFYAHFMQVAKATLFSFALGPGTLTDRFVTRLGPAPFFRPKPFWQEPPRKAVQDAPHISQPSRPILNEGS